MNLPLQKVEISVTLPQVPLDLYQIYRKIWPIFFFLALPFSIAEKNMTLLLIPPPSPPANF